MQGCGSDAPEPLVPFLPTQPRVRDVETGTAPLFVRLGDLDGDGSAEIVASDRRGNALNLVGVAPDGTRTRLESIGLPHSPAETAILDVNADGLADIVVAYRSSNALGVWTQIAGGTFAEQAPLTVGEAPQAIRVADFDLDGRADLAVTNVGSNSISLLFGRASGFEPAVHFGVGAAPVQLEVADFSGDARPDLAVSNFSANSVSLLYASGVRNFVNGPLLVSGVEPFGLESHDLNGDGFRDLVVANEGDGTLSRYFFTAAGPGSPETFPVGPKPDQILATDTDFDGVAELLVTLEDESGVAVVHNRAGRLQRTGLLPTRGGPVGIDGAGRRAVTANFFGSGLTVLDF